MATEAWLGGLGKAKEAYLNDGSASRKAKEIWFHNGTSAVKVFAGVGVPALSNHTLTGASAQVNFRNDGTLEAFDGTTTTVTGEWLTGSPGTVLSTDAAAWEVQFTWVSGPHDTAGTVNGGRTTKSGSAYDVGLNLATTRSIVFTGITGLLTGTYGGTLVFDAIIRPAGGGSTLASGRFTLNIASA